MATRIAILEGWGYPGNPRARRKRHRPSKAQRRVMAKMKACAVKWSRGPKRGKYTAFIKRCMEK